MDFKIEEVIDTDDKCEICGCENNLFYITDKFKMIDVIMCSECKKKLKTIL